MDKERLITNCLNVLQTDIRLMNMALAKREESKELIELFSILESIAEQAVRQVLAEKSESTYQQAHC